MGIKHFVKKTIKAWVALTKEREVIPIPKAISPSQLLEGKTALITGGSGGIGSAIAESFARHGAEVILAGTDEEKLRRCCRRLAEDGLEAKQIVLNVLDISRIAERIRAAAALSEKGKIDILVNAAGAGCPHDFLEVTEEDYDLAMGVNAKGTFFMSQEMAKFMVERKLKGHILNVSSSSALRPAWTPYQMSKWAVKGFTKGAADKLAEYGIVVNAIGSGPTATPMLGFQEGDSIYSPTNPSGRLATPSEIAVLATFMVSDMGDLIVGDTFYMTGGAGTVTYHN